MQKRTLSSILVMIAAAFLMSACETLAPNEIDIRMTSTPPGALVYSASGKAIGMTPMEKYFVLTPEKARFDTLSDEALVVWPSGASIRRRINIRPAQNRIWTVNFSRPAQAPGLDVDLAHAARLQQQQQNSASADVTNLLATFASSYAAGRWQAVPGSYTPPATIRCKSRASGWSVVTDCADRGY